MQNYMSDCKPFKYVLLQDNSIKELNICSTISINLEKQITMVVTNNTLKCFQFNKGKLKQINFFKTQAGVVNQIHFFIRKKNFLSNYGNFIIERSINQLTCTKFINKFTLHSKAISCFIIHPNQNIVISGSYDTQIKFWQLSNCWNCMQIINEHKSKIIGICINQLGNQAISYGEDRLIIIIRYNQINWEVQQKILVQAKGLGLSIISDNIFTFQQEYSCKLDIYMFQGEFIQFQKVDEILATPFQNHPQEHSTYISNKQILINFCGYKANLFRFTFCCQHENQQQITWKCKLEQIIDFFKINCGTISNDGQFLITWDYQFKEIQVWQYQEIEDV